MGITWQHPRCCIDNIIVATETTGRGRCKFTGENLSKAAPKLGVRSHTATSWLKLEVASQVLGPVMQIVPEAEAFMMAATLGASTAQDETPSVPAVEGFSALSVVDAGTVRLVLQQIAAAATAGSSGSSSSSDNNDDADESSPAAPTAPVDTKGKTLTGRVAWKFGGHVCFGELLPRQETASHCFARTKNGNTKTLAKGKSYWWLENSSDWLGN